MGNYTSIEDLKNDPMLTDAIRKAINSVMTIESKYHEEVKEVKKSTVSSANIGTNILKGMQIAGLGTQIKVSQTSKSETILKTSYYANVLSKDNGKPEVKLIVSDLLNMTEKDNTENEMPNFFDPVKLCEIIGYRATEAYFDFDKQELVYKSGDDEEQQKRNEEQRLENLKNEKEKRIELKMPTIEETIKALETDTATLKSIYDNLMKDIQTLNKNKNDIEFNMMKVQVEKNYIDSYQIFKQCKTLYDTSKKTYDTDNEEYERKRLQYNANIIKTLKESRPKEEETEEEKRIREEEEQKKKEEEERLKKEEEERKKKEEEEYKKTGKKSSSTSTVTSNSSGGTPPPPPSALFSPKVKINKDKFKAYMNEIYKVYLDLVRQNFEYLDSFEKSLGADYVANTVHKLQNSLQYFGTDKNAYNNEISEFKKYATPWQDAYYNVSFNIGSIYLYAESIYTSREKILHNALSNVLTELIKFYYQNCYYKYGKHSSSKREFEKAIDFAYNYKYAEVKSIILNFYDNNSEDKFSLELFENIYPSIATLEGVVTYFKPSADNAKNVEMYNNRHGLDGIIIYGIDNIIETRFKIFKTTQAFTNLYQALGTLNNELSRLKLLIDDKIYNKDLTQRVTFLQIYDIICNHFKMNIDEKITNIVERIATLNQNITLAITAVASNVLELNVIDVEDSYIDIAQYNESRIEMLTDFDGVGNKLKNLPQDGNVINYNTPTDIKIEKPKQDIEQTKSSKSTSANINNQQQNIANEISNKYNEKLKSSTSIIIIAIVLLIIILCAGLYFILSKKKRIKKIVRRNNILDINKGSYL